ncbi:MAG: MFS transporter [Actinomycetota bacterium]
MSIDAEPATLAELLRRRSVRNLLVSRACASSGAVTLAIAMGVYVFDITGREADIGFVGLAEFLPTFLLVLWAGSLADRFDRRRMAAMGYVGEAAVAFAIAWYAASGATAVWPLFALTAAYGTARGFANPASRALPANVVSRQDLPRLIPALSTTWQLAAVFAPLLVGLLYGVSAHWTFAAIGVLDLVAAATVVGIRLDSVQERVARASLGQALQGLRLVARTPLLLAAIGLDLFAVLLGGVVALAPPIAAELLEAPEAAAFWMRSAGGAGAVVTAAFLAFRPVERHVGRVLLQAVAVFGLVTIGVAFSRALLLTLFLFALLAAADMVSVFIRATIVPLATPDSLRGRVLAVEAVFIGASNELGAFESGITAEWFGLVPAIIVSGVATIVVVVAFALGVPDLRRLDRFSEIEQPP